MPHHEILSYDQYAEIERGGYALPYVVEVVDGNQQLTFYGASHTNDPVNLQFIDIEERWEKFNANAVNPIALVEGHSDEVSVEQTADRSQSILSGGESQFMVHLARHDGVPVYSPEPDQLSIATKLADEFGQDGVVLFYFVNQLNWWNRLIEKPDIEASATHMLDHMEGTYQWGGIDFSIEGMQALHQAVFGKPLDMHDQQWLREITTPVTPKLLTNLIARRSGELRDEYLISELEKYWHEGSSPFTIFGAAHAIRLEPALRKLSNEQRSSSEIRL